MLLYRVFHAREPGEEGTTLFDETHGFIPGADVPQLFGGAYVDRRYPTKRKFWKLQAKLHMDWENRRPTALSSWTSQCKRARSIARRQILEGREDVRLAVADTENLDSLSIQYICSNDVAPARLREQGKLRPWEWLVLGRVDVSLLDIYEMDLVQEYIDGPLILTCIHEEDVDYSSEDYSSETGNWAPEDSIYDSDGYFDEELSSCSIAYVCWDY